MFHKRIAICMMTASGMTATLFAKTRRGLVFEKRLETATFAILKNQYHIAQVRILLSENDTYLKLLQLPKGVVVTRDLIKDQMSSVVPEPVDDGFMDWKTIGIQGEEVSVQVFVVKKSVLAPLIEHAGAAGVIIEACEPPSLAMARLTKHIKESFLLVYPAAKPEFLVAVSGGRVLEVSSVDALHSLEHAKKAFVEYVGKLWGVTLTAIATDVPNPMLGLAAKTDFQGEDMDVLTIPSVNTATHSRLVPIPFIIGGVAFLVVMLAFLIMRVFGVRPEGGETASVPSAAVVASPTPSPAATPPQKSQLSIEIQNGNGEAGLAGKWKTVLEEAGYTNITTANADNYEYRTVIVQAKTALIVSMLVADLGSPNAAATAASSFLDSSSSVDAIVIVGRNPAL